MRYFLRLTMLVLFLSAELALSETVTFNGTHNTAIGSSDYFSQGVQSVTNGYYWTYSGEPALQPDNVSQPIVFTFVNLQSQVSIDLIIAQSSGGSVTFAAFDAGL